VADVQAAHDAGVLAVAAAWAPTACAVELQAAAPHVLFTEVADFHAWLMRFKT
jgi:phosphoglycolate phosphatase-like HAD superfamily hydrolase